MTCPYCERRDISERANAKTCGQPKCAEAHRQCIKRQKRGNYERRVRQDACEMERKNTTDQLIAECQRELAERRGKRHRTRHHWEPYSGHLKRRVELNWEKMRLWS